MTETFTPDRLILDARFIVTDSVTVTQGQNLKRGAVIGMVTNTGKAVLSTKPATNGSQAPYAILAESIDATDADKPAVIYLAGEFDRDSLTFGEGHDADSVKPLFRTYNIYIKKSV